MMQEKHLISLNAKSFPLRREVNPFILLFFLLVHNYIIALK